MKSTENASLEKNYNMLIMLDKLHNNGHKTKETVITKGYDE